MPRLPWPRTAVSSVSLIGMALCLSAAACTERAEEPKPSGEELAIPGQEPERPIPVDPCAMLTAEEIGSQIALTVSQYQRADWSTDAFEVSTSEPPSGRVRVCEFAYQSRHQVSGGPAQRGLFTLEVMWAEVLEGIREEERKPIPGVADEAFHHLQVYYARKGDLAVALTHVGQTADPGLDPDAPRLALLRAAAGRLP